MSASDLRKTHENLDDHAVGIRKAGRYGRYTGRATYGNRDGSNLHRRTVRGGIVRKIRSVEEVKLERRVKSDQMGDAFTEAPSISWPVTASIRAVSWQAWENRRYNVPTKVLETNSRDLPVVTGKKLIGGLCGQYPATHNNTGINTVP